MNEQFDLESGELLAPVNNGAAIAQGVSSARVQMSRDRMAMGLTAATMHGCIARAVAEMPIWIQTDKPGAHKIKYATLKSILEVVRPLLMKQGIRIRQGAEPCRGFDDGGGSKGRIVPVYTDLIETHSGVVERTTIEIPLTRFDPQAMGSAITYGKRYSILAALGLTTDEADDDGARAMSRDVTQKIEVSNALDLLKSEIDACKDKDALIKWGNDPKTKKRTNELVDDEAVLLRLHYAEKGRKLLGEAE
jgi:hypothetical protein